MAAAAALGTNLPRPGPLPILHLQSSSSAAAIRPLSSSIAGVVWRSPSLRSGNVLQSTPRAKWSCDSSFERKRLSAEGLCRNAQCTITSWACGSSLERRRLSGKGLCKNVECTPTRWTCGSSLERKRLSAKRLCRNVQCTSSSLVVWRSPILRSSSGNNVQYTPTSWTCGSSFGRKRLSAKGLCRNVDCTPTSGTCGLSFQSKRLSVKGLSSFVVCRSPILRSSSGGNVQYTPTSWSCGFSFEFKRLSDKGLCGNVQCSPTSWTCGFPLEHQRLSGRGLCSRKKCGGVVVAVGGRHVGQGASRDRVVDFGKFKGAMMGTLSSKYLKWMVNNLKAGPLSEWSDYAEEVLADPYYRDRLEWEKVEKLMTAAHDVGSITGNRDVVLAPAKMYGWDLEDDVAWRKVNFSLIGTSKGGRIPRVKGGVPLLVPEQKKQAPERKKKPLASIRTATITTTSSLSASCTSAAAVDDDTSSSGSLREELMSRRAQRRDRLMASRALLAGNEEAESHPALNSRFPGRESLLSTIRSSDISK